LPRFLASAFRLVGFWGEKHKKVSFASKCEKIIDLSMAGLYFPFNVLLVVLESLRFRPKFVVCCIDDFSLFFGWLASKVGSCSIYVVVEDPPFTDRYSARLTPLRRLERSTREAFLRRMLTACNTVFAFIEPAAISRYLAHGANCITIRPGYSDEAFEFVKSHSSVNCFAIKGDVLQIGYVGALSADQGIEELISAFSLARKKHMRARLVLLGDPSYTLDLPKVISKFQLESSVEVTGWLSYSEMLERLASCDICCHVRRRSPWAEAAYPLKICEYLGLARPVISWDYAGCRALLNNGEFGELIPPGDIGAFASGLLKLDDIKVRDKYTAAILRSYPSLRANLGYGTVLNHIHSELSVGQQSARSIND
jgi:Glycosyltransferase